jgi:hypothetical protein
VLDPPAVRRQALGLQRADVVAGLDQLELGPGLGQPGPALGQGELAGAVGVAQGLDVDRDQRPGRVDQLDRVADGSGPRGPGLEQGEEEQGQRPGRFE